MQRSYNMLNKTWKKYNPVSLFQFIESCREAEENVEWTYKIIVLNTLLF